MRPRSGLALKAGITVLNAPGTIDADYRGEIGVIVINLGDEPFVIRRGERIAQLIVAPMSRVGLAGNRGAGGERSRRRRFWFHRNPRGRR